MKKGQRNEKEAAELYERAGYRTFRPPRTKFDETDMFGLFDVLAVPPAGANAKVRMAQVKTNGATGIESWRGDAMAYASASVHVEFLVRYDGHGGPSPTPPRWRLIAPEQHGGGTDHRDVVDEREEGVDADGEGVVSYLSDTV